ncbi:hypothetical protein [Lignipirellula cremea]|uniref:LTXXQ motif protein n=1 Tax=Lignipirellula cremea TaxID=2528010 RepID=A0A518DZS5_9BACT|nr:hypothetical protein [Lignipirellula cremea]QDU97340.1 hypothetical protein Pla8534_51860 [Lignipirellula cremea]
MKRFLNGAILLVLTLAFVSPSFAGDKAAKKPAGEKAAKGEKKPGRTVDHAAMLTERTLKSLSKVELTAQQKEEIGKLAATYAPKLAAARTAANYSKEQAAAMKAAREKATADGLKGKEAQAAVAAAVALSPEQKTAHEQSQSIQKELMTAVHAVLTEEQRAALGKGKGAKREKKADKNS